MVFTTDQSLMSRTLISILEKYKFYPETIVADNKPGGSGAKGWGYVFAQKGNPYHITSTSGSFITTPLQANTPWQPGSFTPVALLAADDMLLVVNKGSKATTLQEFIAAAKAKPPSIGGIGAVNIDFIVPKLVSEKAGFTFNYVAFNKQGELITALLSGARRLGRAWEKLSYNRTLTVRGPLAVQVRVTPG